MFEINRKEADLKFLTVGGIGHASQIAFGIANQTNKQVICIDGDGASIMHFGLISYNWNKKAKKL